MSTNMSRYRGSSNISTPNKRARNVKGKSSYKLKVFKNVTQNKFGFPNQLNATLKYCDYLFMTCVSGVMNTISINANSLYDPYAPTGGHQPMYFDQMMGIYNHWVVLKARMKVTWVGTAASEAPSIVGIYVNDDATVVPPNWRAMCEQSSAKSTVMPSSATDLPVTVWAQPYDAVKVFGPSPQANSELRGDAVSNPSELSCWTLFFSAMDGISTTSSYVKIEVEYDSVFFELKDQDQS